MRLQLGGLWRQPDFLKLWAAETISATGSQVRVVALPLTAVLVLGASPAEMGLLGAVQSLPVLLFALVAGAWADRVRRRPLLIGGLLGMGALVAMIPLTWSVGL